MEIVDRVCYVVVLGAIGIVYTMCSIILCKRCKDRPAYMGISFGFILYYVIVPIYLLINMQTFLNYELNCGYFCNDSINKHILYNDNFGLVFIMIFIAGIFFNCSYFLPVKKGKNKKEKKFDKIKLVKNIMYLTLIFGGTSLVIFFYKFGGIFEALKYSEHLRSFSNNSSEIVGNANILIIPARLMTATPFLLVYLNEFDKKNKNYYNKILVISLILSALFYLYNAGRAPIIMFCLCFLYMFLKKRVKKTWTLIIILAVISLPLLDVMDQLFVFFRYGTFKGININYTKYIYQFIYPFRNVLNINNITEQYGFRFFTDFVTSILDLLPKVEFEASYVNTSLYINGPDWKIIGGIPNDFVTFGYIQLGGIGVMILSIFLGRISKTLDCKIINWSKSNVKMLYSAVLTVYGFSIINNSDFVSFIRGNMILIIISLIVYYIGEEKKTDENSICDINTN